MLMLSSGSDSIDTFSKEYEMINSDCRIFNKWGLHVCFVLNAISFTSIAKNP